MKKHTWTRIFVHLLGAMLICMLACNKDEDKDDDKAGLVDADGNVYTTVTIGSQVWMVENLKTTKYNDGTTITHAANANDWNILTGPAYCWYNNHAGNKEPYGALYNGYAVKTGKLCPKGWHVPTDAEWTTLGNFLGGEQIAGGKLKEAGTSHWQAPNAAATNSSGFTGLPGGFRYINGICENKGYDGYYWTSTESADNKMWYRFMYYGDSLLIRYDLDMKMGYCVRCLQD